MPVALSYPGVYIQEIPSSVRTITGVATSIAAFIGRAKRGPVNEPVSINSYADFERIFGGLWLNSSLGYAVRDFYRNGGSQAVIVRLYEVEGGKLSKAKVSANGLELEALSEGSWGNALRARVDIKSDKQADNMKKQLGINNDAVLFDLRVRDMVLGIEEQFQNLTLVESTRKVDRIVNNNSQLVKAVNPPDKITTHTQPEKPKSIWEDDKSSSKVSDTEMASDGADLGSNSFTGDNYNLDKKGLYALDKADIFNILCIPPFKNNNIDYSIIDDVISYCERRRAMFIIDSPSEWNNKDIAKNGIETGVGSPNGNAALFFPRLRQPNPLRENQIEEFAPCGAIAGIFARTDTQRGVWKAPAGLDATLVGVPQLSITLTDLENGELNQKGINCLRTMPAAGRIVWGARTRVGDDRLGSEWKYIPVRRTALFIEESLYRGTQWVVFEPNDEPLWSKIRLNIGAFMHELFRQGAFQGSSPKEAYFVKCDRETTTQNDINKGIVNIHVGFSPLKPAEFVVISIQQMAGQIQV